jgi:hypothetical protein
MSLPASIASAILDTILGRLAPLLLSGAARDLSAARHAASRMLAAYDVQTEEELRVAAEIIGFGLHALEALSQSANPDLTLNQILRLRTSAVSLSRESHKWQRLLDKLQRTRRAGAPQPAETQAEVPAAQFGAPQFGVPQADAPQADPTPTPPRSDQAIDPQIEQAIGLTEIIGDTIETANRNDGQTWTQLYRQRLTAKRLAARELKRQRKQAARGNRPNAAIEAAATMAERAAQATLAG